MGRAKGVGQVGDENPGISVTEVHGEESKKALPLVDSASRRGANSFTWGFVSPLLHTAIIKAN